MTTSLNNTIEDTLTMTKIIYFMDNAAIPYRLKIDKAAENVTFGEFCCANVKDRRLISGDFKSALTNQNVNNFNFFAMSYDEDMGLVIY